MSKENDFDYEELRDRGDLAIELIVQVLTSLDLLIAFDEKEGTREVIFTDRTEYLKTGDKRAVATEFGMLNSIIYHSEEEIPDYVREKHMDKIKILNRNKVNE